MLVEQTRGQLHSSEDIREVVGDSNSQIRSRLLAMSNTLTLQLVGKDDPTEVKKIIDEYTRQTCESLREYAPEDFYKRSKIALALIKELDDEEKGTDP